MSKFSLYHVFAPDTPNAPFRKTRWHIMILIQEIMMCKWRAILKYYYKPSYRKDINFLKDILSQGRLTSEKMCMMLGNIDYSHEINYPKWVDKLERDLHEDPKNYKRIKVFTHGGKNYVIDGNHRLKALNNVFEPDTIVNILHLTYRK